MRQLNLLEDYKNNTEHGGSLAVGKRKTARPIATRKPMHIVLRSDVAKGPLSLLKYEKEIKKLLTQEAKRFYVQIYEFSVNSNHLHGCSRAKTRGSFKNFLRSFSGQCARLVLKKSGSRLKKFWTEMIYSRIVEWGRALKAVRDYVIQNELEANGVVPYRPRNHKRPPPKK